MLVLPLLVTVMLVPLRTILVWPVYTRVPETFASEVLVGGGVSTGELVTKVPLKIGWSFHELQFENHPRGGDETSIASEALRPKYGLPQITSASLVWSGPLICSPSMNEIVSQY